MRLRMGNLSKGESKVNPRAGETHDLGDLAFAYHVLMCVAFATLRFLSHTIHLTSSRKETPQGALFSHIYDPNLLRVVAALVQQCTSNNPHKGSHPCVHGHTLATHNSNINAKSAST